MYNYQIPSIQRIYLSGPVSKGVFVSQMLNWANLLEKENIYTHFLIFYHVSNQNECQRMFTEDQMDCITVYNYLHKPIIKDIYIFWLLLRYIKANNIKEKKTIIQTRSLLFVIPILLLKPFTKFKFVYEIRGAGEEGVLKKNIFTLYKRSIISLMLKKSDWLISVSQNLIDYKAKEFSHKGLLEKTLIVHGAADNNIIFHSNEIRKEARKNLKLEGRIVLIYVGSLDKPWQIPEKVFNLVEELKSRIPNVFFLIITPNQSLAEKFAKAHRFIEGEFMICESTQEDLNMYLNASDFGLLLRENLLVNNVASPTKFAEYLLSGMKVIISEGVGDYSKLVTENNLGVVINNDQIDYNLLISSILIRSEDERKETSNTARKMLSKQCYIKKVKALYQNL